MKWRFQFSSWYPSPQSPFQLFGDRFKRTNHILLSPSCFIAFQTFGQDPNIRLLFFSFFYFHSGTLEQKCLRDDKLFLFNPYLTWYSGRDWVFWPYLTIPDGPVGWSCRIYRLPLSNRLRLAEAGSCGPVGWSCRIHRPYLCKGLRLPEAVSCGPVGWSCRIHRPYLCKGLRLPEAVSCGPVGWSCRIHRPYLCKGLRLLEAVSCGPVGWRCRIYRPYLCKGLRLLEAVSCGPVGWSCRIHRLYLYKGLRLP